jgi:PAS domain S-box-containing protein
MRGRSFSVSPAQARFFGSIQVRIVLLSCGIAMAMGLAIGLLNYHRMTSMALDSSVEGLEAETRLFALRLGDAYLELENDATAVSALVPIDGLIQASANSAIAPRDQSGEAQWHSRLETIFISMMNMRVAYTQMRFIGIADHGRELVRVNRTASGYARVPVGQLQQKESEPYFQAALQRGGDGVTYSDVTFNREKGEVELPGTPTLGVMMPVYDGSHSLFGFVVINVDYAMMIRRSLLGIVTHGNLLVVNSDGDYFSRAEGSPHVAFAFHQSPSYQRLPIVNRILAIPDQNGSFTEDGNVTAFARLEVQANGHGPFVVAALQVSQAQLNATATRTISDTLLTGLVVLAVSLLLAYLVSRRFSEALIESESRAQAVLNTVVDGIITIDRRGTVASYNRACETIFQYRPEEVIGKNIKMLMPGDYAAAHDGYLANYNATGEKKIIGIGRQVEGQRKDGTVFPLDLSVSEVKIKGRVIFTGIVRDISGRKAAEDALRASEERYDMIIRAMSIGFWEFDTKTDQLYWSERTREITGYRNDEPLPSAAEFAARRHPDDVAAVDAILEEHQRTREPFEIECRWFRRDGKMIWFLMSGIGLFDRNGELLRMVGSITDITDRKKAEVEREQLVGSLARSNRELDEFAYVASHDLKAPLRVIDNASAWLAEDLADKLDEESKENLQLLRSRVLRMEKLLDDLLEYSRVGRKSTARGREVVTGVTLADDLQLLVEQRAGFGIVFDAGFLKANVTLMPLQQILLNLMNNSIKHHDRDEGRIEVSCRDLGPVYSFSVADDGPGIAPEFHEQIFKMFQTLKPRDRVEGSGIGLAIVRKHIDVLGMTIKVENAAERGTIFRFTYPKPDVNAALPKTEV